MKIFGQNAFALRLPSALSMGLCAIMIYWLSFLCGGKKQTAFTASFIFLLFPMVFAIGTVGILDGLFTCFLTASISFGFYAACPSFKFIASRRQDSPKEQLLQGDQKISANLSEEASCISVRHLFLFLVLSGICTGLAFLTKGFLAYAVAGLVLAFWVILQKKWKYLLIYPLVIFPVSLLVILPWAVLIHRAQPDYWHYFIVVEHLNRFFGGQEAQHAESFFYFLPVLLGGTIPFCLFLPSVFQGLRQMRFRRDAGLQMLFVWLVLPFLFFSASSGKLASYILPCFVPLAVILSLALDQMWDKKLFLKNFKIVIWLFFGAALLAALGIHIIQNHLLYCACYDTTSNGFAMWLFAIFMLF